MTTQNIINFFKDEHTRVALAFLIAFAGYLYPSAQAICSFIAGYLGVSVAVTLGKKAVA